MSYRFARRPRWVVLHVLVLVAVPLFAVAGFWQLRRLDERRERNALVEQRRDEPVRSLEDVLDDGDATYRHVRATGTFDPTEEVVLAGRGRGPGGAAGNHVLTPLRIDDERAILVDRGWVPPELDEPPIRAARPPDDRITIEGFLYRTEGSARGEPGRRPKVVTRIGVATLAAESRYAYVTTDLYLLLQEPQPRADELPQPVRPVEPSEGSHRAYAVQWFLFIPTLLVVYVTLLRRQARQEPQAQ